MMRTATQRRRRPVFLAVAVCVVVMVVVLRLAVVQVFHIPSDSMAPTLNRGELVVVNKLDRQPFSRGEVVVFDGRDYFAPGTDGGRYWVKRIIGLPGDRVACCDQQGRITVNGSPLDEPYLFPGDAPSSFPFTVKVPAERLFLLGDHRSVSADSRSHLGAPGGGMIPTERVVGSAWRILWPPERFLQRVQLR
ncbi:signal peptidase I [Devriesea agamarum]|uniref:signal peptidase I n=1 Tax=Devriesea agamarum TaxID=472569 RepID=UPI00071C3ED3|nr:signal peptidase I [Devriesea agamarum]